MLQLGLFSAPAFLSFSPGSEVALIAHFTDREAMGSFLAQGHALSKWHHAAGICIGKTLTLREKQDVSGSTTLQDSTFLF